MKSIVPTLLLLGLSIPAFAEGRKVRWIHRVVHVAACAAQAADLWTTMDAIHRPGLREANPRLLDQGGSFRTGRFVSLKILGCAAPFIAGEFSSNPWIRNGALTYAGSSGAITAAIAIRNYQQLGQARDRLLNSSSPR